MYWSRKFKQFNCKTSKPCNYIGIAKNDQRHAIAYPDISECNEGCEKIRRNPRVRNNKEEMKSLREQGYFNDVYENRNLVDGTSGICNRSKLHIYRRNQPAARDKLGNDDNYSYSYNEFLRIKKMSYLHNLPTKEPVENSNKTSGYGGNCNVCENDNTKYKNNITWKPNNKKYGVQGAVSSSSRIDRLKLDTIRGSKKCSNNIDCGGKYFAGKSRHNGYGKGFIFNNTHKEPCNIQNKAKGRVRGVSKQNC